MIHLQTSCLGPISQLGKKVQEWKFWKLLLVALPLGFLLYYGKKYHRRLRISPIVILPIFLFCPFIFIFGKRVVALVLCVSLRVVDPRMDTAFIGVMAGMGKDLDYMREKVSEEEGQHYNAWLYIDIS